MELEIRQFSTSDEDFEQQLQDLLARGQEFDPAIDAEVARIIHSIRQQGDEALLELTRKFDRHPARAVAQLELKKDDLKQAYQRTAPQVIAALEHAYNRIFEFHRHQRHSHDTWHYDDDNGSVFGQYTTTIERVGVYVPGGLAAYPSSVLMTVIPAVVAGVKKITMVVPAPRGQVKDAVLAAAYMCSVDRVFTIGGAQAIAALAYGTETVPKVDKIVGPGNAWVSAAKRQTFGQVGIDLIAGPSEVVIACDDSAKAEWAAMDMFAQAEHDEDAQSVLISIGQATIDAVHSVMAALLPQMERKDIIARSLANQGAMICVRDRSELSAVINQIAPEHLGLMVEDPAHFLREIHHAGSVFVGPYSTEVFGDYCAGPNHVLPTSGAARFSSPLGVDDFRKRTSYIQCTPKTAEDLAKTAAVLAREEQLTAHARAADYRKPAHSDRD